MSIQITWGDTVVVAQDAPAEFHPGLGGSVCGVPAADLEGPEDESAAIARLYLVEFSDGEAIEIPGKYLSKEIEDYTEQRWNQPQGETSTIEENEDDTSDSRNRHFAVFGGYPHVSP